MWVVDLRWCHAPVRFCSQTFLFDARVGLSVTRLESIHHYVFLVPRSKIEGKAGTVYNGL